MNIADNLKRTAQFLPDQVAVIDGDCEITFRQFNAESSSIASSIAAAVAVTISHLTTVDELKQVLADCRPKAVLADDDKAGDFQKLKEDGSALHPSATAFPRQPAWQPRSCGSGRSAPASTFMKPTA